MLYRVQLILLMSSQKFRDPLCFRDCNFFFCDIRVRKSRGETILQDAELFLCRKPISAFGTAFRLSFREPINMDFLAVDYRVPAPSWGDGPEECFPCLYIVVHSITPNQ